MAGSLSTHLLVDKMTAIPETTFLDAFSWMKMSEFRLQFDWNLFSRVQLTIFLHWFRLWLGAEQVTNHYLNQCWPSSLMHIRGTGGRWVKFYNAIMFPIYVYMIPMFITMTGLWGVIQVCSTSLCMVQCTHLITTGGAPHLYNRGSKHTG